MRSRWIFSATARGTSRDGDLDVALLERRTIDVDGTLHVLRNDG